MSPTNLQTKEGYHLSTAELHRRVAAYWATHERDGETKVEPPGPASSACAYRRHRDCRGLIGHPAHKNRARCSCACHS